MFDQQRQQWPLLLSVEQHTSEHRELPSEPMHPGEGRVEERERERCELTLTKCFHKFTCNKLHTEAIVLLKF